MTPKELALALWFALCGTMVVFMVKGASCTVTVDGTAHHVSVK